MRQSVSKQIAWVNTAKAFGVVLVITGHLLYKTHFSLLNQLIYSFHMPMFFVLSGYVFHIIRFQKTSTFILKKVRRVLIPAVLFICATIPLYFYVNRQNPFELLSFLKRLFFIKGQLPYNDPCWFFIVIFEIYVFVYFLFKISDSLWFKILVCLLSFIVITDLYYYGLNRFLIFGIDRAILGMGFFLFGSILRDFNGLEKQSIAKDMIVLFCALAISVLFGLILNPKVSMYGFGLGNCLYFIISGLAGSCWFIIVCKYLTTLLCKSKKVLVGVDWICKNSVCIIGTHYVLITFIGVILAAIHLDNQIVYNIGLVFMVSLILAVYLPVCYFVNRYIPLLSVEKARSNNGC